MMSYLNHGWYTRVGRKRLRNEVIDGAIDAASMLYRACIPPERISSVALKVRTLATIADPPHRRLLGRFSDNDRQVLLQRLETLTDGYPALQCFAADCLEHVYAPSDLLAFYLHLVHITNMMQLLAVAALTDRVRQRSTKSSATARLSSTGKTGANHRQRAKRPKSATAVGPTPSGETPPKKAAKKPVAKKPVAKKKVAKKKVAEKPVAEKPVAKKPVAKKKVAKKKVAKKKVAKKKVAKRLAKKAPLRTTPKKKASKQGNRI